jgi:hypothetical protein
MATRMQQRRGTASQWISTNSGNGPILNAGEIGYESDTNKFKIGDGTNHWVNLDYFIDANSTANPSFGSSITFEGATANDYETTFQVTDPTADRTLTFPDSTGTVALTSDITVTASSTNTLTNKTVALGSNTVSGTLAQFNTAVTDADLVSLAGTETLTNKTLTSPTLTTPNIGVASGTSLTLTGDLTVQGTTTTIDSTTIAVKTAFVFEGATSDSYETTLTVTDPTADRTLTLPDATDTLVGRATTDTLTNKSISLASNTVTSTLAQLNTAVTDADVASLAGTETLTNKTLTSPIVSGLTLSDASIIIEGATANAYETTLTVTDPTAARTITFPDATGTVALVENLTTSLSGTYLLVGDLSNTVAELDGSGDLLVPGASIIIEGATDNTNETTLTVTNPTEDRTITFPDATGTVVLRDSTDTLTNKTLTSPKINENVVVTATATELNYVDGVTSAIQTQLNDKAPLASPTFTGTVTLPSGTVTSTMILDGTIATADIADSAVTSAKIADGTIVDADINATAAIALSKLATDPLARANHTGSQTASTISDFNEAAQDAVGGTLGSGLTYTDASNTITVDSTVVQLRVTNVTDTEIGYLDGVTSAIQTQMDAKAPLASPTFTGTVSAATLTLSGDLTVNGTTTTINSTTLAVDDKNIVLGDVTTPSDATADGGGITLKGATDKTLNWIDATDAWTSSENFNLVSGKVYEIAGTSVLSGSTLGSGVTGSSLTSVGTITSGTWTGTAIAVANGGTGATTASTAAAALLPAQATNSGKYLTTDGSGTLSWGTVSGYSAPTLGSTSVASGATVTTIAGLTLTAPIITNSINTQTGTTYTPVLSDAAALITLNNASAITVSIPTNASVAYAIGTQINFAWITGAGATTIQAVTSGTTTILSTGATSTAPVLRAVNSVATAIKIDTDKWLVTGDIS